MGFHGIITTDALTAIARYDGKTESQNILAAERAGVATPLFSNPGTAVFQRAIHDMIASVSATQIASSYKAVLTLKS